MILDAVRGRLDVPLDVIDDRLYLHPRDPDRLAQLAGELGVADCVDRMQKAIGRSVG